MVCGEVSQVLSWANPIAFEIDETDVPKNAGELLQSFVTLKKQNDVYRESLGALCFVDDKMLRALQAADLLGNLSVKAWRSQKANTAWPKSLDLAIALDVTVPPPYAFMTKNYFEQ